MTKYNARKVVVDGNKFDSAMEARYYKELLRLQEEGIVNHFELRPKYELLPKFSLNGVSRRAITYKADFLVY